MELRQYLLIISRRRAIVAAVTLVALVIGAAVAWRGPRAYTASMRLAVSVAEPVEGDAPPYVYYRDYYLWLASEYLADDLSLIIKSDAFAREMSARLGEEVDSRAIRDVLRIQKTHRILDVSVQASDAERARRLATAIPEVIRAKGSLFVAQLGSRAGQVVVIDEPRVEPATTTGSVAVDLGLRGSLGLLAGLALAFLVDYLDSTLRSSEDVERSLGLSVLGEIPAQGR